MNRSVLAVLLGVALLGTGVLLTLLLQQPDAPVVVAEASLAAATAPPTASSTLPPATSTARPTRRPPAVSQAATATVPSASSSPDAPSPDAPSPDAPSPTATSVPPTPVEPTATAAPPTPTPEPQPSPTIIALYADWLRYLNAFRAAAQLPPLHEDTAWSAEAGLHSRYMVMTGDVGHSQNPNSPYYTTIGAAAGDTGNIAIGNLSSAPFQWAINYWLSAPFHAVPMLDPQLAVTGFGEYRDAGGVLSVGATLDVERGRRPLPQGVEYPILWPGNGSVTWVLRYSLPEFPAALSHCTGYSQATGAPIILQIGDGSRTPNVTATTLMRDGEPLAHCQFDETTYTHPDAWTQRSARTILDQRDAIVLIPFAPLLPDATYAVRVDANGQTYTWSFRTAAGPPEE